MPYTIPNVFASQSGNVPSSQLDADLQAAILPGNNAFLTGTLAARPAPDGVGFGRFYFASDDRGGTLYRDNGAAWVQVAAQVTITAVFRSYLAGYGMSTAGGSTTMTIAAGQAADSTTVDMMTLAASIGKTTGAWAVGTGNGGLDTGSIAASTWYHFWAIKRTDTGVVDVLISLSASAPTMPTNYTIKRRIGSGKTDGSSNWTAFVQDGDYFRWLASVLDINTTNPGTSAVSATLTVPTGINVLAILNVAATFGTSGTTTLQISDLAANDEAPVNACNATPLGVFTALGSVTGGNGQYAVGHTWERTNTSAQIRYRISSSGASDTVRIATLGWIDRRGRDA